jgi:DNA-binding beta-propeller fold protein YncE
MKMKTLSLCVVVTVASLMWHSLTLAEEDFCAVEIKLAGDGAIYFINNEFTSDVLTTADGKASPGEVLHFSLKVSNKASTKLISTSAFVTCDEPGCILWLPPEPTKQKIPRDNEIVLPELEKTASSTKEFYIGYPKGLAERKELKVKVRVGDSDFGVVEKSLTLPVVPAAGGSAFAAPVIEKFAFDDDEFGESDGNGDGIPARGEKIELRMQVKNNETREFTDVRVAVDSRYLKFADKQRNFGNIAAGVTSNARVAFAGEVTDIPGEGGLPVSLTVTGNYGNVPCVWQFRAVLSTKEKNSSPAVTADILASMPQFLDAGAAVKALCEAGLAAQFETRAKWGKIWDTLNYEDGDYYGVDGNGSPRARRLGWAPERGMALLTMLFAAGIWEPITPNERLISAPYLSHFKGETKGGMRKEGKESNLVSLQVGGSNLVSQSIIAIASPDYAEARVLFTFNGNYRAKGTGVTFKGHTGAVVSAVFSPDGKQVLTASWDNTARLWDAATGKEVRNFEGHTGEVYRAVFSPDGKQVLTASGDKTARLWDAATGKELRKFEGHTRTVYSAVFSPDGKQVLTASMDQTARLWDAATGKEVGKFEGHTDYVYSAVFSPDGKQVLTASWEKTARLWDAATGKEVGKFEGHTDYVLSAVFSPDGKQVLTASDDKTARLWDAATGKEVRKFEGHTLPVISAVFSADGKQVLTASMDQTARLWDAATGRELRKFEGHTRTVYSAVFSPDGKQVLTASWDKTARLWGRPEK